MSLRRVLDVCAGAVAGISLVIACSDDSPPQADAATCDCPAAEAPLAGRIVTVTTTGRVPPPDPPAEDGRESVAASCPQGATLLSGGCDAVGAPLSLLEVSFPTDNGSWVCGWKNTDTIPITTKAIAKCLVPAQ